MEDAQAPDYPMCPLCRRPSAHLSAHHVVPKSRGGRYTEMICRDCHHAMHVTYTNKELEKKFEGVRGVAEFIRRVLSDSILGRMIRFIAKQDPTRKVRFVGRKKS